MLQVNSQAYRLAPQLSKGRARPRDLAVQHVAFEWNGAVHTEFGERFLAVIEDADTDLSSGGIGVQKQVVTLGDKGFGDQPARFLHRFERNKSIAW